jgi:hypothetical protein
MISQNVESHELECAYHATQKSPVVLPKQAISKSLIFFLKKCFFIYSGRRFVKKQPFKF